MIGLTERQYELLQYLRSCEIAPTIREMMEHLGMRSTQHVHAMLRGLEERGYIRRLPYRARCIELVEQPAYEADLGKVPASDLIAELRRRGVKELMA